VSAAAASLAKVELARAHLRALDPGVEITAVCGDVAELTPADLEGLAVCATAFDNDRARLVAARLCGAAGTPWVDGGSRADLWIGRVSVADPRKTSGCGACHWSEPRLAAAGEDRGASCAGVDLGDGNPSSAFVAHATAALMAHEILALAGIVREVPATGCELRVDLRRRRIDRVALPRDAHCPAEHAFASPSRSRLAFHPSELSLGELLQRCGAREPETLVLCAAELAVAVVCPALHVVESPLLPVESLPEGRCPACGEAMRVLRRARRLPVGEVPHALLARSASAWFRSGDAFAIEPPEGPARVFLLPAERRRPEPGPGWGAARLAARVAALPGCIDVERARTTRLALLGLGHLGSALLLQLAGLPLGGVVLVDRDFVEERNLASHALGRAALQRTAREGGA
jgi:molybdopterin/thiamine biosynthesis adenylyltransferase